MFLEKKYKKMLLKMLQKMPMKKNTKKSIKMSPKMLQKNSHEKNTKNIPNTLKKNTITKNAHSKALITKPRKRPNYKTLQKSAISECPQNIF
jgi:hypothetical protein